jgi:two-component system, chemotaxis family, sensor kinase Cph1
MFSKDDVPVDLTQLRCRACARPHLVYMKNMGVMCSLSIAILVDNELWGLFAFHGRDQPFRPSLHQRISVETVANMVSSRVEALMRKHGSARIISMGESLMRWSPSNSLEYNLSELGRELLDIVGADVLVTLLDRGKVIVAGDKSLVPNEKAWKILSKHPSGELWTASTRADIRGLGLSEEDCPASGFVYFHEGTTQLFLGRRSIFKDVKWAGKPDQPKLRDAQGMLNPRNSFEMYMEKAKQESRSWSTSDLNVVLVLKDRVCSGHAHEWMTALLRNDIEEANIRYFAAMDRAKDNSDFFSHMCHELRTPFHGVMGCLNILHDSIDTMPAEEVKDIIKTALSSGNHMINILNDILNKSKNKILLNKTVRHTVYYATLAKEACGSLKALAKSLELDFQYKVIPEDQNIVIATDRTKITQIVSNIVNSAVKFSKKGPILAKIQLVPTLVEAISELEQSTRAYDGFVFSMEEGKMLTCIDDVKGYVDECSDNHSAGSTKKQWMCLLVSDSGIGMRPNELIQMFEPYTQRDAANQALVGTGLGLYICVSLCQQLAGFIACASTPNQGTNFFVGTPVEILHGGEGLEDKETEQADHSPSAAIAVYGPILIVDDNKVNVKILHRQLSMELKKSKLEVELIDAYGGEEALELYKKRLPSIVIIDYHMPGMDGVVATKRMRKYEEDQDLRQAYVLSYTADTSDMASEVLIASGSNQIMSKPPVKGFIADLVKRMKVQSSTEVMTNYRRSSSDKD